VNIKPASQPGKMIAWLRWSDFDTDPFLPIDIHHLDPVSLHDL